MRTAGVGCCRYLVWSQEGHCGGRRNYSRKRQRNNKIPERKIELLRDDCLIHFFLSLLLALKIKQIEGGGGHVSIISLVVIVY